MPSFPFLSLSRKEEEEEEEERGGERLLHLAESA